MSNLYTQLLDAVIGDLQIRKEKGEKYAFISPKALASLKPGKTVATPVRQGQQSAPTAFNVARTAIRPAALAPVVPAIPATSAFVPRNTVSNVPVEPVANASASVPSSTPESLVKNMPALTPEEKEKRFASLRTRVLACQKCPNLVKSRKTVVFGVGNIHSPLMFVGEAPGADEDEKGEPFVGKAGQLLTKIIQAMGVAREQVYIANILKCRPDTPGQSAGNRKPTPEEMQTCIPYLLEQIGIIQPKVIVALGATAVEGLFGKTIGITKLRGNFQTFQQTPVMPTYHPAYLLRNQSISVKREVWEDMLKVMEKLAWPISEKQKQFFTKSA